MAGYEEYAGLAAEDEETVEESTGECAECGAPTSREVCRKCDLLAELGAT
jgi:recombinational DNA repair protein RecR